MSNRTKLKPCPFCGGEAKLLIVGKRVDGGEEWYVGCENENCSLHPHSTIPYASAEIAAEAWNKRTETTGSAPVGDNAKLREALEKADKVLSRISKSAWFLDANLGETIEVMEAGRAISQALGAPLRNCDVGTAEEQSRRFHEFCVKHAHDGCPKCPAHQAVNKSTRCPIVWGQLHYEEGGAE